MSIVSESRWYAWRLASVAIARRHTTLDQLAEELKSHYTDSEMAEIWRQARIVLTEEDNCWLEMELYRILVQDGEAVA